MNRSSLLGVTLVVASGLMSGCGRQAPSKGKPPASAKVVYSKESQLNVVVLTPEAEKRIGLQTAQVERRTVPQLRAYGGEVTLPASALLTVSAPVSGTLRVPKGQETLPQVGSVVTKGKAMYCLVPHVLSQAEHVSLAQARLQLAQARIDAEGQVKQAQVQVKAAEIAFQRAYQLFNDKAGIKKDLDDADAQLKLAQKALDAAASRKSLVDKMELDTDTGSVKPLVIPSPRAGIVRATYALPGQMVPAGTALFEIMNVETIWIKVPVYVGELAEIAEHKPARVKNLADPPSAAGEKAAPIPTPPTAQPQASAADLYYALANPKRKHRPGERVCVMLPLKGAKTSLTVPWSAIVHDIHGGTWVYEKVKKAERTYARHRVQVRYVFHDQSVTPAVDRAVLAEGPEVGADVVTVGVAEVFGSEFGFGK